MTNTIPTEDRKEACRTYLEQTKLLVALASGFLLAPAGFIGLMKNGAKLSLAKADFEKLIWAESLFIVSVLLGYVVVATIVGSQDKGTYDVFGRVTRVTSLLQLSGFIAGAIMFVMLVASLVGP